MPEMKTVLKDTVVEFLERPPSEKREGLLNSDKMLLMKYNCNIQVFS